MSENKISKDGTIFPIDLIVSAMRDSGYKNTAYALAELIDNSVQAGARLVEAICFEKEMQVGSRRRKRIDQIAVIDNGTGMDGDVLRASLMFGNGTRLNDRSGIGRFGVGLPNASFSQGRKVEIWSWQNSSVSNALYTYIDYDEIKDSGMVCVPEPVHSKPHDFILGLSQQDYLNNKNGTIVLWSKLDDERMTWKTSSSTIKHTSKLAGRIYRHLIKDGSVQIELSSFDLDKNEITIPQEPLLPNDPLYLIDVSSTPAPFDKNAMFQPLGDSYIFDIEWKGVKSQVTVTCSIAKKETVSEADKVNVRNRGDMPYGKDADKNVGVSLVRANRELLLDPSWANHSDPRDRWWGCEISFSPDLDEVFGVVNNKQEATVWGQFAQSEWEDLRDNDNETLSDVIDRLKEEGDPRGVLVAISKYVKDQINIMRSILKDQTKGRNAKPKRHENPLAPDVPDIATNRRDERAKHRQTDRDNESLSEDDKGVLRQDLVTKSGYSEDAAARKVDLIWTRKRHVDFIEEAENSPAFFSINLRPGGLSLISLNNRHLFFQRLKPLLDEETDLETLSVEDCREQLADTREVLQLLFAAWARLEEETALEARRKLDQIRYDWGAMVNFYLDEEAED